MADKTLLQSAGDGTTVPAGYVGEVLSSVISSSTNAAASNTVLQLTSLTIPAGTWLIYGGITYLRNSSTPNSGNYNAAITTSSVAGIDSTSRLEASFEPFNTVQASTAKYEYAMGPSCVTLSSDTTYKLNCLALYSAGTPQWRGYIQAVRIA